MISITLTVKSTGENITFDIPEDENAIPENIEENTKKADSPVHFSYGYE
jgi:hypothetical protein